MIHPPTKFLKEKFCLPPSKGDKYSAFFIHLPYEKENNRPRGRHGGQDPRY